MDDYAQIAQKIIEQQENVIGPVAIEQAQLVSGLKLDWGKQHNVTVTGNESAVIDKLIDKYKELFGQLSVEVSKEAAAKITAKMTPSEVPQSLK